MVSIPPLVSGYGVPQQRSPSDVARGPGHAAAASAAETDSTADPALAALDAALKSAAIRQNGFAPLFADAEALVSRAGLPPDVKAAVQALLGLRVSVGTLDADALAKALSRSGLFLEAALGSGQFTGPDLKSALLNLRGVLETWLGTTPAALSRVPPAPPYPGAPPAGQAPEQSSAGSLALQAAGA